MSGYSRVKLTLMQIVDGSCDDSPFFHPQTHPADLVAFSGGAGLGAGR